jgi:phenylacetate-CoA ligase
MSKIKIYHHLPYFIKTITASVWGYYLRWWRYGTGTEQLIQETLEHDAWTTVQWEHWQENRIAFILHNAAERVPYYRNHWLSRRKNGDRSSTELLENWQILSKETLRKNPTAFLADNCNPRRMYTEHSSGTTGTPVTLWFSRKTVQAWYAIYEARIRKWNGVSLADRWGILGGQLVTPVSQIKPPFWVWNQGLNQLYLSSYHISSDTTHDYLAAIKKHALVYLLGYPSALTALAREGIAQGLQPPVLKIIICNAEPLFPEQKKTIETFFNCPVRDTYGMTELVSAASECNYGKLHLFPDVGITEVFDLDQNVPVPNGQSGRIICTGLLNPDMPLIRYEVGDTGILSKINNCACGRSLPILDDVEGRLDDLIVTRDGRKIGRMDPVFKSDLRIKEAQLIQESFEQIRVKVIPAEGFDEREINEIRKGVQERIGSDIIVIVEQVEKIERSKNGKFRATISKINTR